MLGDPYDRWRDEWAYTTSPRMRTRSKGSSADGGGLVATHTAPICFDDWPDWGDIVGGPVGLVDVVSSAARAGVRQLVARHPVTCGLAPRLDLIDEVYGDLDVHPTVDVLATARRSVDDADQPVCGVTGSATAGLCSTGSATTSPRSSHPANARLIAEAVELGTAS